MNNTPTSKFKRFRRAWSPTMQVLNRRFALYHAGMTQHTLARELKISPSAVSQTINDVRTSLPVATKLAEITGLSLGELWPDGKYQEEHTE